MLIDLDDSFWIDNEDEYILMVGFSILAEIRTTSEIIEGKLCSDSELLSPYKKYSSIFNGYGNTESELNTIYESDFNDIPFPRLFPLIDQSDDVNELKLMTISYIERQMGASKPSRSDIINKMEIEEKALSNLVVKYMNMFTIKNELN